MRLGFVVLLLGICVLTGCQGSTSTVPPPAPTAHRPGNFKLTVGGVDEYNQFLAQNKGKVILVDFWATWCGPCVENFPHTVELSNRYEKKGLATIAVSLDDPENEANVRAFLSAQDNANFDNIISKDGGGQKSAEEFELSGAVPHYRLYNRAGELAMAEDGLPEDLEQRIEVLLAQE